VKYIIHVSINFFLEFAKFEKNYKKDYTFDKRKEFV